jgi:hypothetical protein
MGLTSSFQGGLKERKKSCKSSRRSKDKGGKCCSKPRISIKQADAAVDTSIELRTGEEEESGRWRDCPDGETAQTERLPRWGDCPE